jgi:hypothetical protein
MNNGIALDPIAYGYDSRVWCLDHAHLAHAARKAHGRKARGPVVALDAVYGDTVCACCGRGFEGPAFE